MKKNQRLILVNFSGIIRISLVFGAFFMFQSCTSAVNDTGNDAEQLAEEVDNNRKESSNANIADHKAIDLTDANFQATIEEGIVLVDFWAEWCPPCRIQGPIVEELASEVSDRATIAKVDVDSNPIISNQLQIKNIPTIIIFKDGKIVKKFVGVQQKNILLAALNEIQ